MFPLEIQNYAPSLKVLRKRVRQKKLFMESAIFVKNVDFIYFPFSGNFQISRKMRF